MKKLIFYTDLDGTLLNHHDYCWQDAASTITRLKELGHPIVFNTSKTLKEVQLLQKETDIHDPFVIENGGAVWIPENYFQGEPGRLIVLGKDSQTILDKIEPLRAKYKFESFSQMSLERIAELTDLSLDDASMSSQRLCSEPLIWEDDEGKIDQFQKELKEMNFDLLKGGRFFHITGFSGKGDALDFLHKMYKNEHPATEVVSVALGDSPNDLSMLEQAEIAVVIPRADNTHMKPRNEKIIYAESKGALGWSVSVQKILTDNF